MNKHSSAGPVLFTISAAVLLTLASSPVLAVGDFEAVDLDNDGVLSKREADAVFPEMNIPDRDRDGLISTIEAQRAVPNISFPDHGDRDAPVGEKEYLVIERGVMTHRELEEGTQSDLVQEELDSE